MSTIVLAAATASVGVSAVLVASCLRLASPIAFLVAVYVVASLEIVAASLALSVGDWLTRGALAATMAVVLVAVVVAWLRLGRPAPPVGRQSVGAFRDALRDPIVALLGVLTAVSQLYLLAVSLTVPQSLPDTMFYHLPRAALWRQHHAVGYVANVPEAAVNVFPPNAEIETASSMILSGGDRYVGLVQLLALGFACVGIAGVARRLGFDRRAAVFAALAFSTFTVVMLQTPTALNDLVVASLLITCAYFALGSTSIELVLAALALALALGTKLTTVFALPALALVVLSSQPRRRWPALALSGAAGIAAGSSWLFVNLYETGRFDGGVTVDSAGQALGERILRSFLDLFEMSDAEGTGVLLSPIWGVPLLLVALVVSAVLCWQRRWLAGALAGVAGVCVFVSLPLLVTWVHVAGNAVGHARVALGLGGGEAGRRLPENFYESPMHSSYGLAFIVLFLGACVLAAADLIRRRPSYGALFALVGLPLTLVIAAILMGFDPQHLRYWAFPAALATSVFGIALRVRALAWTAVALAAGTVVISLAYFVPRPGGLVLLSENRGADQTARWLVQGGGGDGDPDAFRYLEESVPSDVTLALAVETNTYLYPAWDARLRRQVVFTSPDGAIPANATWLVVGPGKHFDPDRTWAKSYASPGGWRIYRR